MSNAGVGGFGMGATVAGGLTSALGSIFTGQAQQQMFNYQAGIANLNATIANQNAEYARQAGELQATAAGVSGAATMGQIVTAQAGSGLDVNSGSAKQVQSSQTFLNRTNQAAIRSTAAKTAYDYQTQGVQFGAQAQLDTLAGKNAAAAGMIGAESSIIGSASAVSSEWLRGTQLGMWGQGQGTASGLGA